MRLPKVPREVLKYTKTRGFGVGSIEVYQHEFPEGLKYKPHDWVITGQHGAPMHEDRHMPRWSVLLVCRGDKEWELAQWRSQGYVDREWAGAGKLLLLDLHQPHSLLHMTGSHRDGWVALGWSRSTREAAENILQYLKDWLREDEEERTPLTEQTCD